MADDDLIEPTQLDELDGREGLGSSRVLDFWRWALGDLRMNNARGYLVEYLVARALNDPARIRVEWGPFDVQAADGTRVEVKTAGRLQSWALRKPSTSTWSFKSVRADRVWSEPVGDYVPIDPADRVHVWVFALQTAIDPGQYDPLSVEQWEFRVVPHRQLLATGQVSARLSFFDRLHIGPIDYTGLAAAVTGARRANDAFTTEA